LLRKENNGSLLDNSFQAAATVNIFKEQVAIKIQITLTMKHLEHFIAKESIEVKEERVIAPNNTISESPGFPCRLGMKRKVIQLFKANFN